MGYLDSALPSKNEAIYQHHLNHRISPNAFQREYVEQSLPSVHEDSYQQQLKQSLPSVLEDSYQQQLKQSLPFVHEDSFQQQLKQSLPSVHEDSYQQQLKQSLPSVHKDSHKQLLQQSLPSVHEDSHQRLLKQPLPNVHEYSRQQQLKRLQHLQRFCSDENVFKNVMYRQQSRIVYYSSFKYNFSYCKVHKAGGTFWTQVFTILRKGASEDVFNFARDDVHLILGKSEERAFKIDAGHLSRSVLVSRDPYSRLFSAFIDKLFLPINYPLAVGILRRQRKNNSSCANHITFEEFLTYIITSVREGKTIDVHWTPIVNLCKPCSVKAFAVVKQETFTADIEYVLKEVGIANDEFDRIYDALHDHKIEATIPGLVATAISRWKENGVEKCMGRIELARRLWTAFKIQGYIKDGMPFPLKAIKIDE